MLELVAIIWLYALVVTSSLFVGVVLVQGVMGRLRAVARVLHRVATPSDALWGPGPVPAPARQLVTIGASAA